ncbi:TPM domain-containing protein [Massilia scottii]|uniref:TPM domain-containing protein n=1 Tax=Massilia scottii TaxID=3057166 RepID=UPI0027965DF3|nr:TPM domain-containing protein [Massilia sp. CCM 9029]MDQ1834314.1 TPM domain-containing protein [Massilia sp. CCM 9029]
MPWLRFLSTLVLALGLGLAGAAHAQLVPVPTLSSHVTDQAGMLSAEQRAKLETVLTEYESKTGSQIAVLLVKSTAPEQIEQYSIRVSDAWKLGRKGVDDGVLLLVAPDNPPALRRLRIEAGRGVQGVLTDAQSKRILQDVIAPHFQQKQFYDGLVAGVGAIATLLNAEQFPAPPQQQQSNASNEDNMTVPLILFGAFLLFSIFRPRRSRLGRGGWSSGATGFIIGSALGGLGRGGGGDGGGFSGGGFSGGGGSFDGGGASGDW